jgi:hypothetical protein
LVPSLVALALLVCFGADANADDRPSNKKLIFAGGAMGVPTYMIGVAIHEGSHALAGKMVGAKVTDYSLIPGNHPRTGKFFFGYVTVQGLRSEGQRAWFLIAPKVSDTILLSGFALLYATDSLPSNHYAQTGVLVLATGFWVDFSKDIFAFWDHNDTVKVYNALGLKSELSRIPARLVHLGLSVAMGYSIYRGYEDLFDHETEPMAQPLLVPMWDTRF